jgi:hypothetical protein
MRGFFLLQQVTIHSTSRHIWWYIETLFTLFNANYEFNLQNEQYALFLFFLGNSLQTVQLVCSYSNDVKHVVLHILLECFQ